METPHRRPSQSMMKPQPLQCVDCGFITSYPNALQMHRLKEHTKGPEPNKPFKCGVCSYQTSFRSNLQKHQRVHTGEKPYTCVCCSMKFSFRSNHKRHEQRCLAARGVRCPHPPCSHIAEHHSALTAHIERQHFHAAAPSPRAPAASGRGPGAVSSTAAMSLNQNLSMTLNPFTTTQDPTQSAMLDLYYKTFADAAHSLAFSSDTHLNSLRIETFPSYSNTPVKCEPEESAEHSFRRSSSCTRKQSHPRRTSSDLYSADPDRGGDEPEEDVKPDIKKLASHLHCPTQGLPDGRYNLPVQQGEPLDREDAITSTVCKPCGSTRYSSSCDMDSDDRKAATSPQGRGRRDGGRRECADDDDMESDPTERRSGSSCTSATPSSLAEAEPGGGLLELSAGAALGDVRVDSLLQLLVEGGRLHRCQHCRILFEDYATYVLHMGCHGATNPFSCHFCSRVFQEKYGFLAHFMKCIGK